MFADSLLENSKTHDSRRGWTTLTSFGLQALITTTLLLIPLLRPVGLPFLKPLATPVMLAPPPGLPPAQPIQHNVAQTLSNLIDNRLVAPHAIPTQVMNISETVAPPQFVTGIGAASGGLSDPRGIFGNTGNAVIPVMPPPPPAATHMRVSRMMEGNLIRRVQPEYPPTAKLARIQGQVVLSAVISKEGTIERVQVLSGHPLLVQSAMAAVRQWRYRPYILNDQPVEVETQITVNFTLSGS